LYDIQADRIEEHDLAERYPARVQEMAETWRAWAEQSGVLPWPYKPPWTPRDTPAGE